ncbi:MAG: Mth938-like domain-containing protein [Burkholderiaceae bacterium]
MKLHITPTQQYQTVTAYDDAGIEINAKRFEHSLLVMPEIAPVAWPVDHFEALAAEHFAQIEAQQPDVVILGTGQRQRFAHPKLTAALTARRIGVECMNNQAACRTYNILMAEGRKVALALIIERAEATVTATVPDQN